VGGEVSLRIVYCLSGGRINKDFFTSRGFLALAFSGIIFFTIFDVAEDLSNGSSWNHVFEEVLIVLIGFLGFFFSLFTTARAIKAESAQYKRKASNLESELESLSRELSKWKSENSSFTQGLAHNIDLQLGAWKLTPAEKDVALMMLKGLSTKEIAELRGSAEKTVRLQSSAIYAKSGLSSRAQFVAYFIEDLLPGIGQGT